MWYIDLDNPNGFTNFKDQQFKLEKIFEYSFSDVESAPLLDLFIRSSSSKQAINTNKKLFVFFLHKNSIYTWNENIDEIKLVCNTTSYEFIELNSTEFITSSR